SSVPPATGSAEIDYGRYRRKLLPDDQLRTRFRLRYAKEEPFRYAGHLDIIRAFYRALRRSDLPVAYSQGFAPRPVIAFGPPLPVGVTSNAEYLDLQMAGHYLGNLVRDLGSYLPPGLRLLESRQILAKSDSLGASIKASEYRILTRGLQAPEHSAALERRAAIPGILDLKFAAPDALSSSPADSEAGYDPVEVVLVLAVTPGAKLFPTLARLFNLTDPEVRCWRIQRRACYTVRADKLVSPMEEL
ncbi:MAG: TIGR03936 family radical SAM-associated protein, partial [candidate division WOR-3 bacterium]